MGREPSISDSDWDRAFTDEELEAIDAICRSATTISSSSSSSSSIKKRHVLECTNDLASTVSPPKTRRRLPESLFTFRKELHTSFSFSPCSRNRFISRDNTVRSPYQDVKFGGRIVYSRTVEEVEKAADELLHFIEAKKSKEGKCILGLDIEWRPTFRKGSFNSINVPGYQNSLYENCFQNAFASSVWTTRCSQYEKGGTGICPKATAALCLWLQLLERRNVIFGPALWEFHLHNWVKAPFIADQACPKISLHNIFSPC
ncbi:unnamed protein product [Fraxinus pennsylvanica]|uniref:Werner Syndrome-like exonuclease n=1 Tax=Fraxinus pennsylvanica TaxID=56036 RepID=A0AAD1Z4M2_9LAMI|nr:unnamed protein product [Fraxinus pennsylvanica]